MHHASNVEQTVLGRLGIVFGRGGLIALAISLFLGIALLFTGEGAWALSLLFVGAGVTCFLLGKIARYVLGGR